MNHDQYWVAADPFRALLTRLIDVTGLPWPVLAAQAMIPSRLAHNLLFGRGGRRLAQIPADCARRLLMLDEARLRSMARWQ